MGRFGRQSARRCFGNPASRARAAKRAFIKTLHVIGMRVSNGQSFEVSEFRTELLSVFSTAEFVRSPGAIYAVSHQNLRDRKRETFEQLERFVAFELQSHERPKIILGHLRGKARELGVPI